MHSPVYLDYAATTPIDPRVAEAMAACLRPNGLHGNPSSASAAGRAARDAIEQARAEVAALIGAAPADIVWTSGATESDNLAILGAARAARTGHVVTGATEHKAVLAACEQLEREGFAVTRLEPDREGLYDPEQLREALRDDTRLVSIMHVNNETGVTQDIAAMAAVCREREILFHSDAAQSAGRLPLDVEALGVDLLSLASHKVYGPKGVGALYVRRAARRRIEPLIFGGGQELGLRAGTLATHQTIGMGTAFAIARKVRESEQARIAKLGARLGEGIGRLDDIFLNGHLERRVSAILNVSFAGVEGESLRLALRDLVVSSGSACNSAMQEPSYVLRALGRDDVLAEASIRFSLGRFTTADEIDLAIDRVCDGVSRLRALAPQKGV
ncbi:IscS subfamily cysteine desulfurase [soil metagenome]